MKMKKAITIISAITLAYFLLATAFFMTYHNQGMYANSFQDHAYKELGKDTTDNIYSGIIDYLDSGLFTHHPEYISSLSPDERAHMRDVKNLFDWARLLYYIAFVILAASLITKYVQWPEELKNMVGKELMYGGGGLLIFIALIALAASAGFNSFWSSFHMLLFPQGNWMFPSNSILITLFPESFFESFVQRTISISALLSVLSLAAGFFLEKPTR